MPTDSSQLQCVKCGATIQAVTAERYKGRCVPCARMRWFPCARWVQKSAFVLDANKLWFRRTRPHRTPIGVVHFRWTTPLRVSLGAIWGDDMRIALVLTALAVLLSAAGGAILAGRLYGAQSNLLVYAVGALLGLLGFLGMSVGALCLEFFSALRNVGTIAFDDHGSFGYRQRHPFDVPYSDIAGFEMGGRKDRPMLYIFPYGAHTRVEGTTEEYWITCHYSIEWCPLKSHRMSRPTTCEDFLTALLPRIACEPNYPVR